MTKCMFCKECKKPTIILGLICEYCNECKNER